MLLSNRHGKATGQRTTLKRNGADGAWNSSSESLRLPYLFLVTLKRVCQKYLKRLLWADVNVTFKGCHSQDQFLFNTNPISLLQINTVLSYHCGFMEAIISNRDSCLLVTCPLDWTYLWGQFIPFAVSPSPTTHLRDCSLLLLGN